MNRFALFTLLVLLLAGCNSTTASNSNADAQTAVIENFDFLTRLGINVSKIERMDDNDEVDSEYDSDDQVIALSKSQLKTLLPQNFSWLESDGLIDDVMFYIMGIKALPNGHTLILFNMEFGDSCSKLFAIYDADGNNTDSIDTGSWEEMAEDEANDYANGKSVFDKTEAMIQAPGSLVLNRSLALKSWELESDGDIKTIQEFWRLTKQYTYTITPEGKFTLVGVDTKKTGPVKKEIEAIEKINDITYLPFSYDSTLDRLNKVLLQPEIKSELADNESFVTYRAQGILHSFFTMQPQQLLTWMSNNRDLSKNAITGVFERCFATAWITKDKLIEAIGHMTDADAKAYISELTAQWGDENAVG